MKQTTPGCGPRTKSGRNGRRTLTFAKVIKVLKRTRPIENKNKEEEYQPAERRRKKATLMIDEIRQQLESELDGDEKVGKIRPCQ